MALLAKVDHPADPAFDRPAAQGEAQSAERRVLEPYGLALHWSGGRSPLRQLPFSVSIVARACRLLNNAPPLAVAQAT